LPLAALRCILPEITPSTAELAAYLRSLGPAIAAEERRELRTAIQTALAAPREQQRQRLAWDRRLSPSRPFPCPSNAGRPYEPPGPSPGSLAPPTNTTGRPPLAPRLDNETRIPVLGA